MRQFSSTTMVYIRRPRSRPEQRHARFPKSGSDQRLARGIKMYQSLALGTPSRSVTARAMAPSRGRRPTAQGVGRPNRATSDRPRGMTLGRRSLGPNICSNPVRVRIAASTRPTAWKWTERTSSRSAWRRNEHLFIPPTDKHPHIPCQSLSPWRSTSPSHHPFTLPLHASQASSRAALTRPSN